MMKMRLKHKIIIHSDYLILSRQVTAIIITYENMLVDTIDIIKFHECPFNHQLNRSLKIRYLPARYFCMSRDNYINLVSLNSHRENERWRLESNELKLNKKLKKNNSIICPCKGYKITKK